jgi:DNA-directed RNA polymerase specialized sigma24 family protein
MGHRERAQAMERALAALEPELRTVVQLRLFEEVPIRAVAEQLGLPLSTAKEHLRRGVIRYRRSLQQILGSDSIADPGEP